MRRQRSDLTLWDLVNYRVLTPPFSENVKLGPCLASSTAWKNILWKNNIASSFETKIKYHSCYMKSMTYYNSKPSRLLIIKKSSMKIIQANWRRVVVGQGGASDNFYAAQPLRIMHFMDVIIVNFKIVNNKIYIKQKFQDEHRYLQIGIFKEYRGRTFNMSPHHKQLQKKCDRWFKYPPLSHGSWDPLHLPTSPTL